MKVTMQTSTFATPSTVDGRTLYRYVLSGRAGCSRTCCRWMESAAMAESDALMVAKEWGTSKRALKVRLVYPVPVMPGALNEAAGAP